MCRKLICLVAFVFLLGVVSNASAELVAQWRLDEGSGTTVSDSSGNDIEGTFEGDPQWVAGKYGGALDFDGDDSVNFGTPPELVITGDVSITCWVNPVGLSGEQGFAGLDAGYAFKGHGTGVRFTTPGILDHSSTKITLVAGEWQHVAATFSPGKAEGLIFYYNGVEAERMTSSAMNAGTGPFRIASNQWSEALTGMLDEVRVYNHILIESEILAAMEGGKGYPYAFAPDPADGAIHAATWVTLSWKAGDFAVSHDVYLGESYDEVSEATIDSEVFRGNQADLFVVAGFPGYPYPDGLAPGTTYYWRIDEVNEADPNSPWKGPVWSFSVPPKTAYNPVPADGAENVGPDNVTLTWTGGFGSKLHTVYFGDSYDAVNDATGGAPLGVTSYKPGPLEAAKVYYWRVDEFDAVATYKGDVWIFTTPGAVGGPQPAYGATDVGMNATLSWTPADSAASHQLYFGADQDAVRNADTSAPEYKGSKALGAESYDPGLLDADTSYYWRVDEVDAQGNVSTGPLWIFTTGTYLLVDDFESYTDDDTAGQAIWQTWIDGFGVADNGAQVGYLMPPYAEQTIVHGGAQSMPLMYVNEAGVTNSEASMTLTAPRDWTQAGVAELSLWFRGASANAAEPLYVAISNSSGTPAVVANDDPSAATVSNWTQWIIPLQAFADQGINLSNVNTLAIGLGTKGNVAAPGGTGTIYVDDIRLYP
jgi:hypothetical protein